MMEAEEWYILPFKRDEPEPEKAHEPEKRRIPPEQERTIYVGDLSFVFTVWDKCAWRGLPGRPKYFADYGDMVISLALTNWPDDGIR